MPSWASGFARRQLLWHHRARRAARSPLKGCWDRHTRAAAISWRGVLARIHGWKTCSSTSIGSVAWSTRPLGVLDELPYARRRERQFPWLDTKRAERVGHGVCDHATNRNDTTFAGAFGPERIVGGRLVLQRNGPDGGEVAGGRHQVVGKRAGQQLALIVVDQLFEQRAP